MFNGHPRVVRVDGGNIETRSRQKIINLVGWINRCVWERDTHTKNIYKTIKMMSRFVQAGLLPTRDCPDQIFVNQKQCKAKKHILIRRKPTNSHLKFDFDNEKHWLGYCMDYADLRTTGRTIWRYDTLYAMLLRSIPSGRKCNAGCVSFFAQTTGYTIRKWRVTCMLGLCEQLIPDLCA